MKRTSRTNWERLNSMPDSEIDYGDIPPLDEPFFQRAQLGVPGTVALDPAVLAWFKRQGGDYAERINAVLRQHIAEQTEC